MRVVNPKTELGYYTEFYEMYWGVDFKEKTLQIPLSGFGALHRRPQYGGQYRGSLYRSTERPLFQQGSWSGRSTNFFIKGSLRTKEMD